MSGIIHSVLAVLGGYVAMVVVVVTAGIAAKKIAPAAVGAEGSPSRAYVVTNMIYSFLGAMLGGAVVAWAAPNRPVAHVFALAALVLVLAAVSAVQMGNRQPRWYQAALAVIGPVGAIVGGYMRAG